MQRGMAPPQGFALSNFLSKSHVFIPDLASISAAHEPLGPPPITATLYIRKKIIQYIKTTSFLLIKVHFLK